jgi:Sulfotransferase family
MNINLLLLTGAMRSGTSVLAKILGSLNTVEFFYEPMMFVKIINNDVHLLDDYIYHDLMMPALAGRNINLNSHDDSSIYNYKSVSFIENRLSQSWPIDEIHLTYDTATCCIKYPSYINQVSAITSPSYPVQKVFIAREPIGNVLSLLKKQWFSDAVLADGVRGDFKKIGSKFVPMWLANSDVDQFYALDELGRCLFYYIKCLEINEKSFDVIVSYEALCATPMQVVNNISRVLSLSFGDMTNQLVTSMRPERQQQLDISANNVELFNAAKHAYQRIVAAVNV